MKDKFTMELVWYNCETHSPKYYENNTLIVTDGVNVYGMSWHKAEGYFIATEDGSDIIPLSDLSRWWWADIEKTVRDFCRCEHEK